MTAIEQMVIPIWPEGGRWMLFAAASSFMESGALFGVELLSVTVGGLVLLAYTAATLVLAIAVTPRRDVM